VRLLAVRFTAFFAVRFTVRLLAGAFLRAAFLRAGALRATFLRATLFFFAGMYLNLSDN